jgi:ethanolamine ammonia-lyase small subunit
MSLHKRDIWNQWKESTSARIGLGRSGTSLRTQDSLALELALARAKDSLHQSLDWIEFKNHLELQLAQRCTFLESQANTLDEYLTRPDRGRLLNQNSKNILTKNLAKNNNENSSKIKLGIAITNGLSSQAILQNAIPFLFEFFDLFHKSSFHQTVELSLFCIQNGRVAIIDDLGSQLELDCGIVMVGERPGLSSPNSMGIYLTYKPRIGLTDDSRNCISNIRPEGLNISLASRKLLYLLEESLKKKLTGVQLKDRYSNSQKELSHQKTLVKICGVRNVQNAVFALESGADMIGLNISKSSKRMISIEEAKEIAYRIRLANDHFGKNVKIVLLTFQNSIEELLLAHQEVQPDFLQLVYSDPFLNEKWDFLMKEFSVIPSISINELNNLENLPFPEDQIFVIDNSNQNEGGGTGKVFDWKRVQNVHRKYILAGGLNPENVEIAVEELHPWAVDVASGVESDPGKQSQDKIFKFIQNAKRIS